MEKQPIDLKVFEQFIYAEVRCIDERNWDKWLSLFVDDGDYWIPLCQEDTAPGKNLSILHEDKHKMELRCRRYLHPLIHAQSPASRTSHVVSNIVLDSVDAERSVFDLHAQFCMWEHRSEQTITWTGAFKYTLQGSLDNLKIKRKKVILINSESQMESIQVPF